MTPEPYAQIRQVVSSEVVMLTYLQAASTVVIAAFAVIQVVLAWRDRRERTRSAHQVVWAEWNRLFSVSSRWQGEDLVKLADAQVLDPDELLPPDSTPVIGGFSLLGHGAARMGAAGLTFAREASRNCRMMRHLVTIAPVERRTPEQTAALMDLDGKTKYAIEQAVVLLEDAMRLAPSWIARERFDLGEPHSELGKRLVTELRKQPLTRMTRVRRRMADAIRWVARYVDTPSKVGSSDAPSMDMPTAYTGVYASAKDWPALRNAPQFVEIMRLARIVNSLGLAYHPFVSDLEDNSPGTRRDRFAAFTYSAALMHEGLRTAEGLAKHFRHLKEYRDGFQKIFADRSVQELRSTLLGPIRNKIVFHFDLEAIATGLDRFPDEENLIATLSNPPQQGEIYFDAADDASLGFLFGDADTKEDYNQRLSEFIEENSALFKRFMRASHSLIPVALAELGCYKKPLVDEHNAGQ